MLATNRKEYPVAFVSALALLAPLAGAGCMEAGFGASSPTPFCEGDDCIVPMAAPTPPGDTQPVAASFVTGENVQFVALTVQQRAADDSDGPVLADIVNHLPSEYGNTYYDSDKITWAHETTHGINSHVRNEIADWRSDQNGFYVCEDRAVVLDEPDMRKSVVAGYVPSSLRGSRYDLYLEGMGDWDDTPTYILDEFVAYTNGGAAGVDLAARGLWNAGWRDGVAGQLEFTVYAIALLMATEEHDPTFFRDNTQYKEFIVWNARRAMRIYREGSVLSEFRWDTQDQYYEDMRTARDAEDLRAFARRLMGDAVTDELLGLADGGGEPDPGAGDGGEPDPGGGGDDGAGGGDGDGGDGGNLEPVPDDGDDPLLPDPTPHDADADGIVDAHDLCNATPVGRRVWRAGEWIGCAGGEFRDRDVTGGQDSDGDGVKNRDDQCSGTPAGRRVWRSGEWKGCAGGQYKDPER